MRRSDRRRRATDELYFFRTSTGVPVRSFRPVDGLPARPSRGLFGDGVRVVGRAAPETYSTYNASPGASKGAAP